MKIALLTRYSDLGASSRLRFSQFVPFFERAGISTLQHSFFDDEYLQRLYSGRKRKIFSLFRYYQERKKFLSALPESMPLVIEYELFPHLPWEFEKSFLKKHPYFLNFDDAVDLHYEKIPVLKHKYPQLIANAQGIITANDMLMEKYRRFNSNIIQIPTVPPPIIRPGKMKSEKLTLVWTGTPITEKFLYERIPALQKAAEKTDFRLLAVGADSAFNIPDVECEVIPWSPENEAAALAQAHAGIMPLPDTPFARGKSAYKLICYLRAGIPGIASPVGANCQVIKDRENGFLAVTDDDWATAIKTLTDQAEYSRLAAAALDSGKAFLPESAAEKLLSFLAIR